MAVEVDVTRAMKGAAKPRMRLRKVPTLSADFLQVMDGHTKIDMIILFQPLLVPLSLSVIIAAFCRTDVRAAFNLYS